MLFKSVLKSMSYNIHQKTKETQFSKILFLLKNIYWYCFNGIHKYL